MLNPPLYGCGYTICAHDAAWRRGGWWLDRSLQLYRFSLVGLLAGACRILPLVYETDEIEDKSGVGEMTMTLDGIAWTVGWFQHGMYCPSRSSLGIC